MSEVRALTAREDSRRNALLASLGEILLDLTGIDPSEADADATFFELGADSLFLLQASQAIQNKIGAKVSFRMLMEEAPTLNSLASYLDGILPREETPEPDLEAAFRDTECDSDDTASRPDGLDVARRQSAPAALDGRTNMTPHGGETERVMARQLQAMVDLVSQQLEFLGGGRGARNGREPSRQPHSEIQARLESSPAFEGSSVRPVTHSSHSLPAEPESLQQPVVSSMAVKKRSGGLSSRQRMHLDQLARRINGRTARSKRFAQDYRYPLADSSASAGFRLAWKELLYPLVVERSAGSRVWDLDGNEYIDLAMGFGSLLFGHSPSFVTESIQEQVHRGFGLGLQAEMAGKVARLICELTGVERVTFCNSGTEAVMMALRLARCVTGRSKIVIFAGSYHGTFDGLLARSVVVNGSRGSAPVVPGVPLSMIEDVLVLDYGNAESLALIEAHKRELAAVLVEPVQSRRPELQPRDFLRALRALTAQAGIPLIFDEVITGFRVHLGGVQALFDLKADLTIYGKAVGAGMPIGVVAGKAFLMDSIDGGMWDYGDRSYPRADTTLFAGTFFKHPLVMASAWASLNFLKRNGNELQEQLNLRTGRLVASLNDWFGKHRAPIRLNHFGSLFRFSFPPDMPLLELLYYHLLEEGIHVGETRNCFLSTAHTDEDVERIIGAVKSAVAELRAGGILTDPGTDGKGTHAVPVEEPEPIQSSLPRAAVEAIVDAAAVPRRETADTESAKTARVPLTEAQKQLWVVAQLGDDASCAYNESMAVRIRGALNPVSLLEALQCAVDRHEALRTTFSSAGDYQIISEVRSVDAPVIDFSSLPDADRERQASQSSVSAARTPFNLERGPLLRAYLIKLDDRHHSLVLNFHHIVVDGWSFRLILGELLTIYSAGRQGLPCRLRVPLQYTEYSRWLANLQESGQMRDAEAYWRGQFADTVPVLDLPTDYARPATQTYIGGRQHLNVDQALWFDLKRFSARQCCTVLVTLLAGFAALLHRLTDRDAVVIGIPAAGQLAAGNECLVGYCVNLLPLRSNLTGAVTVADYLAQVRASVLSGYEHQIYGLIRLVKALQIPRDASRPPLVAATFNSDRNDSGPDSGDLQIDLAANPTGSAKFDISLNMIESKAELQGDCDFNTALFETGTIQRWLRFYQNLLRHMVQNPMGRVSEVFLMSEQERRQLIVDWNATRTDYRGETTIVRLFERQVEEGPDRVALIFEEQQLTYRGVNGRANQLARFLKRTGAGADGCVGLCLDRSTEIVIGIVGVLKAGASYLPIDPSYPRRRIGFMLRDAGVTSVIVAAAQAALGEMEGMKTVALDRDWPLVAANSGENLDEPIDAGNAAYVIYTSGSTGDPKGVVVSHRDIANTLLWRMDEFSITAEDRIMHTISFVFDPSIWQLFGALLSGASVVITRASAHHDIPCLIELIRRHEITITDFPPSLLRLLVDHPAIRDFPHLRYVFSGGDALSIDLQARFFDRLSANLYNQYGPTEASVDATYWQCRPGHGALTVPIGRPIANKRAYILDSHLQPVPVTIPAQLFIGGLGLARCYLNHPDSTAERFIPDPFGNEPGVRLYKTGDLASYLDDGNIQFLGRIDNQVKIRGFRVELEEVETALRYHEQIANAAVVASQELSESRLVAYLVADAGASVDVAQLRDWLIERLPEYMIPARFVLLETMPLLPSGKVDRVALPRMAGRLLSQQEHAHGRTPREKALAEIWAKTLGLKSVGIYDNFFAIGGDSVLGIQIASRAAREGLNITARQLFQYQTVAELAAVARVSSGGGWRQDVVTGPVPLTPVQHWFFEQEIIHPEHWNQAVMLELRKGCDPGILSEAIGALVAHHDALRLRFERQEGGWRQWNAGVEEATGLSVMDLSGLEEPERAAMMTRGAGAAQASLNLGEGPLIRCVMFVRGEEMRLLIVIHHLAVDGVSWRVLLEDLERVTEQMREGEVVDLGGKTASFKEWAEVLGRYGETEKVREEAGYWLGQVAEGVGGIPVDYAEGVGENREGTSRSVTVSLSAEETQKLLQEVPGAYHTQINEVLLAALGYAVREWSGKGKVLVDVEGHGREEVGEEIDLSRTVGWTTAIYPVVLEGGAGASVVDVLKEVKERVRGIPNRGIGYGVLRYLGSEGEIAPRLKAGPQAEISFNYLGQFDQLIRSSVFRFAQESVGPVRSQQARRRHLVDVNGHIGGARLQLIFTFRESVHRLETIQRLANGFIESLQSLVALCQGTGSAFCIPSDFPLALLDRPQLDILLSSCRGAEDIYPLSPLQQGILFHSLQSRDAGVYFNQLSCTLVGNLDSQSFKQAWGHVVKRYSALRTSVEWEGLEQPLQVVHKAVDLEWHEDDWRGMPESEQAQRLQEFLDQDRRRGFDLRRAPLIRWALLRTADHVFYFVLSNHHLIIDGWSLPLIFESFFAAYEALQRGRSPVMEASRAFRDYIAWLGQQDMSKAESFWRELLKSIRTPTRLRVDGTTSGPPGQEGNRQLALSRSTTAALHAMCRQLGLTMNTVVQGAWALLVSRYSGDREIVFGGTVAGRPPELAGIERMVGLFINTLPVKVWVDGAATGVKWLRQLQQEQAEMRQYEYTPLVQVQGWSSVERGLPLFESLLVFENYPVQGSLSAEAVDLKVSEVRAIEQTHYPLTIMARMNPELTIDIICGDRRFAGDTAARLLASLRISLESIAARPDQRLCEIPTMSEAERSQVMIQGTGNRAPYQRDSHLAVLFAEQVERTPEAVALVYEGRHLTFDGVNQSANQLARYLMRLGIAPEERVAIWMNRSEKSVISMLAIVKAGAAYLPLDPANPKERLGFMLGDAEARMIVTHNHIPDLDAGPALPVVNVDSDWTEIAAQSPDNPALVNGPDNLAYVIYTSGSTGLPKGVGGLHGACLNRFSWMWESFPFDSGDVCCQKTSLGFVDSVWEVFGPLLKGVPVVVVPDETVKDPHHLISTLAQTQVTCIVLVPSLLRMILDGDRELGLRHLRYCISSGERLSWDLFARFRDLLPDCLLLNLYGSSEVAADVTSYNASRNRPVKRMPIGAPISNTRVYLLDADLQHVVRGVAGEVYVGGDNLARGYVNHPDWTADRFFPDPFNSQPGARTYKTGDLARWLPDATIEYLGRTDHQVKIRGFRVELGEIEALLCAHDQVREAVVAADEDSTGGTRLAAYVVPRRPESLTAHRLREYVRDRLPEHMRPSALVIVDELPRTPSGKVDRPALSLLRPPTPIGSRGTAPPRDALELELVLIWEDLLRVSPVAVTDNFFDLGGHSILALSLAGLIQRTFGRELPLSALLEAPTIEQMADFLRAQNTSLPWSSLVRLQPRGPRPPLFLVHPAGGNALCYVDLSRHIGADQPVYGLQSPALVDRQDPYAFGVKQMAATYIEAIREVQPQGPYFLGGWSFGGLVAFEMAQQLDAMAEPVGRLVLFDTPAPVSVAAEEVDDAKLLAGLANTNNLPVSEEELRQFTGDEQLRHVLRRAKEAGWLFRGADLRQLRRSLEVFKANIQAGWKYVPRGYRGEVTLFRAISTSPYDSGYSSPGQEPDASLGWAGLISGPVDVRAADGNHFTIITDPQARRLARQLRDCLEESPSQHVSSPQIAEANG